MEAYPEGYINYIRRHIGHELIFCVSATGIILNDKGHILVNASESCNLVNSTKEIHEPISHSLLREAYEKYGVKIQIERTVGVYSHPDYITQSPYGDWVQPWSVCFIAHVCGGSLKNCHFKPLSQIMPHSALIFNRMLHDAFSSSQMVLEPAFVSSQAKPHFPVLRQHIKQKPIILPGAIALVKDESERILVTKRADLDVWDLPSGFSDLGETATYTAIRETREETGLQLKPTRTLGVYSDPSLMRGEYANGDVVYGVGLLVEGQIIGGQLQADGQEASAVAFLEHTKIYNQSNLRPITRQILEDIEHMEDQPFIR